MCFWKSVGCKEAYLKASVSYCISAVRMLHWRQPLCLGQQCFPKHSADSIQLCLLREHTDRWAFRTEVTNVFQSNL